MPSHLGQRSRKLPPPCPPLAAATCLALLTACSSIPNVPPDVDVTGMPNAELALRRSVSDVDAELAKLGTMRPVVDQPAAAEPIVAAELQKVVSFEFSGLLDGAVHQLADSVGYATVVHAPEKAVDLPIAIKTGPVRVLEVFRQLGDAVGDKATVLVDPVNHEVVVTHHV